jgi:nucleosome binding factor SPN SPT16 subunit
MGILFDAATSDRKEFLIKELRLLGVTTSQNGTSLEELSFEELNYEFIQALFRKIDIERDENRWF